MRVLDLCCGMGWWSIGFRRQGFETIGVDILDVGYPYELILSDIQDFHFDPKTMGEFDVVVASPPCTEFSQLRTLFGTKNNRQKPADPEAGMKLVQECYRIILEVCPRFWAIENVQGAIPHFKNLLGKPQFSRRPYYLWGKFPGFLLIETKMAKPGLSHNRETGRIGFNTKFNPMISWIRARIPLPISLGLAAACKDALNNGHAPILGGKSDQ